MTEEENVFPLVAKTMSGLEEVLSAELTDLGAGNIEILKRAVKFTGNLKVLYNVNYRCRTALRILMPIASFRIYKEDDFYHRISKIKWEEYLSVDQTFAVDATVNNSVFSHSQFVALRCKDAIVDRFRARMGQRPSVELKQPNLRIDIHLSHNECSVSLDSSGDSLHKRGYHIRLSEAPISEVLAAGMIALSGWDKKTDFMDFMCGSGTIPIEATMIASNIPAGYYRDSYGFMKWKNFDKTLWDEVKQEADSLICEMEGSVYASDNSEEAISIAAINIKNAKLHHDIQLEQKEMSEQKPRDGKCFIICNPPYGERIKPENIVELYKSIGDTFKQNFAGCQAWIISSAPEALKFVGLKPSRKLVLFNGPLECRFVKFEMYEGSKKAKYDPNYKKPAL
ncbi:MAG: THUMP domain-containing protein [Bacteroidales bacterium]|nr:THUMP domain-containing protein [Bacteroidales bacterium]